MSQAVTSNEWMTPEEALNRFQSDEMSLLDLNLPTNDDSKIRYGFVFDNLGFLIGDGILSEVISNYVIYPMPNCISWLSGLTNVRGNLVPVYDLRRLLGINATESDYKHLLIIDKGSDSIGILVERLPQALDVINWKATSHRPELSGDISKYIHTSYLVDSVIWLDFNHRAFFKSLRESIAV